MHVGKEYMRMCMQAEELQAKWNPAYGDIYTFPEKWEKADQRTKRVVWMYPRYPIALEGQVIWIPRQGDLQGFVASVESSRIALVSKLVEWLEAPNNDCQRINISSMEQIWLAFVMRRKWNKMWDGEIWIESD